METFNTGLSFMQSQDKLLNELYQNNTPLQIAATEAHRVMVKRIFEEGKDSDGAAIKEPAGSPPIYINPKDSPKKFTPIGKGEGKKSEGKVKPLSKKVQSYEFSNKKGHLVSKVKTVALKAGGLDRKTRYFGGGYAEFKKLIGRDKLVLFGTMRNDFRAGIKKLDQSSWVSYFKNSVNAKKADGLEERYQKGEIFSLTKDEILLFKKLLIEGTIKYMNGIKND